jgi:hypothetical protein
MSPQRKAGTIFFFERRCSCSVFKGFLGSVFKRDFRIFFWSFKGTWIWFFFWTLDWFFVRIFGLVFLSDFGLLDGLTQEYGLVFRTLDLVFQRDVDLVFLSDFGLVLRSDFWIWFFVRIVGPSFLSDFRIWFFYRILDILNSFV